jgi:hypothetical protein
MCDVAAHVHPTRSCCQDREGILRVGRTHCSTSSRCFAPWLNRDAAPRAMRAGLAAAHTRRSIAPHASAQTSTLVRSDAQSSARMRMNAQLINCVRMNAHSSSLKPRSEDLRATTYSIAAMLRFAATSQIGSAALCCTTHLRRCNSEFRTRRDLSIPMRERSSRIPGTRITES